MHQNLFAEMFLSSRASSSSHPRLVLSLVVILRLSLALELGVEPIATAAGSKGGHASCIVPLVVWSVCLEVLL